MPTVALKGIAKRLERHDEAARIAVHQGLRSGARFGRTHLVSVTKKDRGMAKAAWKVYNGPLNARGNTPAAWIENSAPYIGVLELGARPHAVSEEGRLAIFEWVLRHFRGIETGSSRTSKNLLAVSGETALGSSKLAKKLIVRGSGDARGTKLAWDITNAICWKIKRFGSKPGYFVRDSMTLLTNVAKREVERKLKELSDSEGRKK